MSSTLKLPKIAPPNYNTENLSDLIETKSEEADIINAINSGYLIFPSVDFVLERFQQQSDYPDKCVHVVEGLKRRKSSRSKSLPDEEQLTPSHYFPHIHYLDASDVPIIEIGDICLLKNLRILNLSENHLKHINPLVNLVHLMCLDLHGNQIIDLPDKEFWLSLNKLRVLYMHNNPIGRLDYLKSLSASESIEILTMYDTPMSLRKNYRHHVVNALVMLKALDEFVISDEEIIEEAIYKKRFKAHAQEFFVDLTLDYNKDDSFDALLKRLYAIVRRVNWIISHNSPVHILQRFTRGFIARNRYRHLQQHRRMAKINAQLDEGIQENSVLSIDNSEVASRNRKWWKKSSVSRPTPRIMENKFNGNENVNTNDQSFIDESMEDLMININELKSSDSRQRRNIIIDLNKLNKIQYNKHDPQYDDNYQSSVNFEFDTSDQNKYISFSRLVRLIADYQNDKSTNKVEKPDNSDYQRQMKNLVKKFSKQFNINLNEFVAVGNREDENENENETTKFRLPMLVPDNSILQHKDRQVVDMMKEKHDDFKNVKDMLFECHKKVNEMRETIKPVSTEKPVTNDQRFFQKAFGNMNFGCLRAIDKAYMDRNLVDTKHQNRKKVEKLKEQNKYSLQRVEYYKEDKIKETKEAMNLETEQKSTYDMKFAEDYTRLKEHVAEVKKRREQLNQNRRRDVNLAVEFSKQHLSVSKALQKHEYMTYRETKSKENNEYINKLKSNKEAQRELVRKYMQQRNVLRLIQSNNDRAIINKRLQEDNEEEERNAKMRVEYLKYLEYNRRARVLAKKPKAEKQTNVLTVGDSLPSTTPDHLAHQTSASNTTWPYVNQVKSKKISTVTQAQLDKKRIVTA